MLHYVKTLSITWVGLNKDKDALNVPVQ